MANTEAEWIVKQFCGHVSRWWFTDREDIGAIPVSLASVPCSGAPVVGWGEWCPSCRDIVPIVARSA